MKHLPQLFDVGPQIALKRKRHYVFSWSAITTKLDIYVYKYKDDFVCKGLCKLFFGHNKYLIKSLAPNKPLLTSSFNNIA